MFISSENYRDNFVKVVDANTSLRIAVSFWGKGADELINAKSDGAIRIVCNLMSGGTNPEPIRKLLSHKGVQMRHLTSLHAKVVLGENDCIIGSANISTNGLNHEDDENNGWQEAGFMVSDEDQLREIGIWFEKIWNEAKPVTEEDLLQAQKIWDSRRKNRVTISTQKGFLNRAIADLKDRAVYVFFSCEFASEEAMQVYEKVKESLASDESPRFDTDVLDFFEDAEDLPKDASLINVHIGERDGLSIAGPYRRVPELDKEFNDAEGDKSSIQIMVKENKILEDKFDSATRKSLLLKIKERPEIIREIREIREILLDKKNYVVSLYELLTGKRE